MKVSKIPLTIDQRRKFREKLDQIKNSNAEYQRNKTLSRDERVTNAVDRLVNNRKKFNDFRSGRDTTEAQARKDVEGIVRKYVRDNNIE